MKHPPNRKIAITLRHEEWIRVLRAMAFAADPRQMLALSRSELAMEAGTWVQTRAKLLDAMASKIAGKPRPDAVAVTPLKCGAKMEDEEGERCERDDGHSGPHRLYPDGEEVPRG